MQLTSLRFIASSLVLAGSLALTTGCSGTNAKGPSNFDNAGGSAGSQNGGNLDGGLDADADQSAPSPFLDATPNGDGSLTADSACAAEHVEAQTPTLNLYIMADQSGSMGYTPHPTGWENLTTALNGFFSSPEAVGTWVALNFFPCNDCSESPSADQCQGDEYVKPNVHGVDWGELPGYKPTLMAALNRDPDGITPTEDALNGALRGALEKQMAYPEQVVAVVMISDGHPTECSTSTSTLESVASKYANGTPAVHTFAIYTENDATAAMSAIAKGGGTGQAFSATGGSQQFIDALKNILHTLVGCEFKMPTSEAGTVDPDIVEVQVSTQGAQNEGLDRIKSPDSCGTKQGWHYDDDNNPAKIILCPATCNLVKSDKNSKIDILLGCEQTQR